MAAKDLSKKKFFTTGQIAKICGVSIATVQKWIDAGEIDSYRLPLTASERRVPRESLLTFMKKYNVPTGELQEQKAFRILMIDADVEYQKQVKKSLEGVNDKAEFKAFEEGTTALVELGAFKPDLILLDIHTPGMEGMKIIETLGKTNSWKDTRVAVIAELSDEEKTSLEDMGVGTIIAKPVKPQKLKKELTRLAGDA